MYQFHSIIADKNSQNYRNYEYIPQILMLYERYKSVLLDDYYSADNVAKILEVVELINSLYPHFYAITKNNAFMGFVYLDNWKGRKDNYHSCTVTTCVKPEYWGEDSRVAGHIFLDGIIEAFKVKKIKAEVFQNNHRVVNFLKHLGFIKEATLKNETIRGGKPIDINIYAKII